MHVPQLLGPAIDAHGHHRNLGADGSFDSSILIRTLLQKGRRAIFRCQASDLPPPLGAESIWKELLESS